MGLTGKATPAKINTLAKQPANKAVGEGQAGKTDAAITAIYDQLVGNLTGGVAAQRESFDRAKQLVDSSYDQIGHLMGVGASGSIGGLEGQFERLGIGDATDSATQGIRNQLNQSLVSAARRRASEGAGLARQGGEYEQIGRQGIDNAYKEQAQVRSTSATEIAEAIANMEAARVQAQGQADLARIQGQSQLAQARASGGGGGGRGGGGGDMTPEEYEEWMLDMAIKEQKLNPQAKKGGGKLGGQAAVNAFLTSPQVYWNGKTASPAFKARADAIYNRAMGGGNAYTPNYDPYENAMQQVNNYNMGANKDALREVLQYMMNKNKY